MEPTFQTCFIRSVSIPAKSSKARSPPTCLRYSQPDLNSSSTFKRRERSASRCLQGCLPSPTRLSNRLNFAALHMSAPGIVSRVTPVHTAVRNCTRDEGRPFEVGNQVLISSHRKLLLSKAMVVNVAEKSGQDSGRQG